MGRAARRWREALASWAIPEPIPAAAPESPWGFPTELFARRADAAVAGADAGSLTPSNRAALEALPEGGTVLDVGSGAGAASLPLAGRAGTLAGFDPSPDMLEAFRERALRAGVEAVTVLGSWPQDAARALIADVVVCGHVAYNVPDLPAFAIALGRHARERVVMELTAAHPMASMNGLWRRFHGLERPTGPTAGDAVQVLREAGIEPNRIDWEQPGVGFEDRTALVAWVRRRLCLPPDRDPEIEEAVAADLVERADGSVGFPSRGVVTLWWPGIARPYRQPGPDRPGLAVRPLGSPGGAGSPRLRRPGDGRSRGPRTPPGPRRPSGRPDRW